MTDDDAAVILRVVRGDRSAYSILVGRYLRAGLAVAWEFAEDRDAAEDILQDAFIRALEGLPRFDVGRSFPPWFFTIVRNCGRNWVRRRGRSLELHFAAEADGSTASGTSAEAGKGGVPIPAEDPWPGVERRLDVARVLDRLPAAMDRLSPKQRQCFRLCDLEGFPPQEVSVMLGLADATVRVHLHRARAALRQYLGSGAGVDAGSTVDEGAIHVEGETSP